MIKNKRTLWFQKGVFGVAFIGVLMLSGCQGDSIKEPLGASKSSDIESSTEVGENLALSVSSYEGRPYVELKGNHSGFTKEEIENAKDSYELYSDLDSLGRVGVAEASLSIDTMPSKGEKRGSIGMVKPSGWVTSKYDFVDGKYLYNRCHLIGWQLGSENANEKNLMTGTRSFNVDGMLPFENMVGDYIRETEKHVLYRVTPVYKDSDLVAQGVQMEACSVEDECQSIDFNVFVYNVENGVVIDYTTGENRMSDGTSDLKEKTQELDSNQNEQTVETFVVNKRTKKIHKLSCSNAKKISPQNRDEIQETLNALLEQGYSTSGCCFR